VVPPTGLLSENPEERLRVLGYIERYGDRSGFQKGGQGSQMALTPSRKTFAAS
jgi:hypothetical protein